jgi:hypothetical protein
MLVVLSLSCGISLAGSAIPNLASDRMQLRTQPNNHEDDAKLKEPSVATKKPCQKGKVFQKSTLPKFVL